MSHSVRCRLQLWRSLAIITVIMVAAVHVCSGEIHRAKSANSRPYHVGRAAVIRSKQSNQHVPSFDVDYVNVTSCAEDRKDWLCNFYNQKSRSLVWTLSLVSAALVGLSGVLPLLFIPLQVGEALKRGGEANDRLKLLLSFAVGGLLGDVFLHLLPEAWVHLDKMERTRDGNLVIGCWVLAGLLIFMFIEKLFPENENNENDHSAKTDLAEPVEAPRNSIIQQQINKCSDASLNQWCHPVEKSRRCGFQNTNALGNIIDGIARCNGFSRFGNPDGASSTGMQGYSCSSIINGYVKPVVCADDHDKKIILTRRHLHDFVEGENVVRTEDNRVCPNNSSTAQTQHIKTSGWLNLMANVIDNFTHGLAVAGSFSVSIRTGFITLFAILLHEIPHEIGDFAILLRSGFDRWTAAKAQLLTATGGLLGALAALTAESAQSAGDQTAWILPFTSGGFIYIAMVTVLPDLVRETNPKQSLKQFAMVCGGIAVMAAVTLLTE